MKIYGKSFVREELPLEHSFLAVGWAGLRWELENNPEDWFPGCEKWGKSERKLRKRISEGNGLCRHNFTFQVQKVWVLPALGWIFDPKEFHYRPRRRKKASRRLVMDYVKPDTFMLCCWEKDDSGEHCLHLECGDPLVVLNHAGSVIHNGDVASFKVINEATGNNPEMALRSKRKTMAK